MLDRWLSENAIARRLQSVAAQALFAAGIGANPATGLAAASGIAAAVALGAGALWWGLGLLALSAAFDAVDGTIARQCDAPTPLGGIFDLCSDRLVEAAVIVAIIWRHRELAIPGLILVASWYVNITVFLAVGAALERRGPKLIDYPPGILERTEAMIFFAVLAIVESFAALRWLGAPLCIAMIAAELATGAQRFVFGWRMLRSPRA
jgi:phosphatidylglycerophosphate synthase